MILSFYLCHVCLPTIKASKGYLIEIRKEPFKNQEVCDFCQRKVKGISAKAHTDIEMPIGKNSLVFPIITKEDNEIRTNLKGLFPKDEQM